MNFKANIFKTITLTVVVPVLSSCILFNYDKTVTEPSASVPTMYITEQERDGWPLRYSLKIYREGQNAYDSVNNYLENSFTRYDSIPKMNFQSWHFKVVSEIDSVLVIDEETQRKLVWRKTDSFEESQHHFYNPKSWKIFGDNGWNFAVSKAW